MDLQRWDHLKQIFQGALDHPTDLTEYLDRECGNDADLRSQVEALLDSHDRAGDFLAQPILTDFPDDLGQPLTEEFEKGQIGPYRIVRQIGSGGMGTVYMAERCDGEYERTVAIKVVARGMNTDSILARFRLERQILANLDHPNIARLLDGAITPGGRPYIVMEHIVGVPIDDYCNQNGLSTDARLRLFAMVCSAVQHAHKNSVIHRDIKPSNVLVTAGGIPKLLDFGIGKIIGGSPSPAATLTAELRPMTLEFASPEQVKGEELTASTDIYSLGVLLYILLSGHHPYQLSGKDPMAARDIILNTEVAAPSRVAGRPSELFKVPVEERQPKLLQRRLSGDLDNIVMTCLRKEPQHRYASVADLNDDIQRHLEARPIKARPETRTYRFQKYVRRNQSNLKIAGYTVASCIILLAGLLTMFGPSRLLFGDAIPFERRDWLILSDFENQTGEDVFDRSLNTALSVSLEQSAFLNLFPLKSIEGSLRRMKKEVVPHLDATTAGQVALREGIKLVVSPSILKNEQGYLLSAAIIEAKTGRVFRSEKVQAADRDRVLKALDELARLIRNEVGETSSELSRQNRPVGEVSTSSLEALKLFALGTEHLRHNRMPEARQSFQQALAIDPDFISAKGQLGILLFEIFDRKTGREMLASVLDSVSKLPVREQYNARAFHAMAVANQPAEAERLWKELLTLYPDIGVAHNNLGRVYRTMSRWDDAAASFRRAIEIDPYLMISYFNLAWLYEMKLGDLDSAIALCRQQLSYDETDSTAYTFLGWAYLGKGDVDRAESSFEKAVQLYGKNTIAIGNLGYTHIMQNRHSDAVRNFLDLISINPADTEAQYLAGVTYLSSGDATQARRHFESFMAASKRQTADSPNDVQAQLDLARAQARLGAPQDARKTLAHALTIPARGDASYTDFEIARVWAVLDQRDEALRRLDSAVNRGMRDYTSLTTHPDLAALRKDPEFERIAQSALKPR